MNEIAWGGLLLRLGIGAGLADPLEHDGMAGDSHAVPVALEFVEGDPLVPGDLEHAHEVGVLLVAAEHLHFAVAGEQERGRGIGPDVVEGREFVDDGLLAGDTAFATDGHVGDGVAAEGDEPRDLVGIDPVGLEPAFVEAYHAGEVAAG